MSAERRGRGPVYGALLALSGLCALGAVLTLIPWPWASWPNILGYKSLCTFAPAATFGCSLAAALVCTLRARLVRKTAAPLFAPILAILILLGGFIWSTAAWSQAKAHYADASSSASIQE